MFGKNRKKEELPVFSFSDIELKDDSIITVMVFRYKNQPKVLENSKKRAEELNNEYGISPEVAEAMMYCSMNANWNCPEANPKYWKKKKKDKKDQCL